MAFEKFEGGRRGIGLVASIAKNGTIYFHGDLMGRFGFTIGGYACLYYDKERALIGIKPATKDEMGARKIIVQRNAVTIGSKAALDSWGISFEKSVKCPISKEEDFMVLEISKAA